MTPILVVKALVGLITPPSTAVLEPVVPVVVVSPIVLYNFPEKSLPVPKLAPPS